MTGLSVRPRRSWFLPLHLPLRLAADASAYGVGAVISHTYVDATEHPIAYASRTLSAAERNYSQIDEEALTLVFAVQKFHPYLYGRNELS